jgi:hypothetical protein
MNKKSTKSMQPYVLIAKKKGAKKVSLSKFITKDSKKVLYSNLDNLSKIVSPFGATSYLNTVTEASKVKRTLDANDVAAFKTAAKCDSCGTHWVASASFRKENKKFNCMVCANELEVIKNPEEMNELVQDIVEDEMNEDQDVDTVEGLQDLIEESSDEDDNIMHFEVYVEDGDTSGTVLVSKDGYNSRWTLEVLDGDLELNGKTYQSYLKPEDIISWMRKDYDLANLQSEGSRRALIEESEADSNAVLQNRINGMLNRMSASEREGILANIGIKGLSDLNGMSNAQLEGIYSKLQTKQTATTENILENIAEDEEIEIVLDGKDSEEIESTLDSMDEIEADNEGEEHANEVLEENAAEENSEEVTKAPEAIDEMELPEGLEEPIQENIEESYDKYNLATLLNKAEYKDKIELVLSSLENSNPCYYILVNRSPVAVAEFKNASEEVKALFADANVFSSAFIAALDGLAQTEATASLKNFGIKPIMAPVVSKKAVIAYNVKKIQKKLEASFKKREQDMFATWQQCFSTALVASCKGLKRSSDGKAKGLVVKATLADTMKSAGIQNASMIVEEAFKRGIQRDFGHIVEEALSLYQGTPEKREAWATMVGEADYAQDNSQISIQASGNNACSQDQKETLVVKSSTLDEGFNVFASLRNGIKNRMF